MWVGFTLLGLFVLIGYLLPAAILLAKWAANKGWRDVEDVDNRVSLFTVRKGWRTAFSYLFIFKTAVMSLAWTLPESSANDGLIKVSQIAAGKIAIAIPVAMILAYTFLEGVGGIMVVLDFYEELKRREKRRLKAEAEEREAKIRSEAEEREAKARAEAEEREALHAAEVARLNAEIERLKKRNGIAD